LGVAGSSEARGHLRLAGGLVKSAKVRNAPSEYELRNAFSRSYYSLFHACRGYLWASGVDVVSLGKKHGRLHDEMEKWWGKAFGDFLRKSYELRRKSDYIPEWNQLPLYKHIEELKTAQRQCYFVIVTGQNLCRD
jgi:uncharacterized protein (UPF0332 family)